MKNKDTIIHVIDSLERGGAETLLISLLEDMNKYYKVVLVTLVDKPEFEENEIFVFKRYCLNHRSRSDLISSVRKLKRIISLHKPVLVRSDLFLSTVIARLSCPQKLPLIFAVHNFLSENLFSRSKLAYLTERITYRKRHTLVAVSQAALDDYRKLIHPLGKHYILPNFVSPKYFETEINFTNSLDKPIRLVAVGNLKEQKNYFFLLNVIKQVKDKVNLTLDIYGDGHLRDQLQAFINKENLPVRLLGKHARVYEVLPNYDVFIMCSLYEGFGLASAEAMAIGLPLILNDLEVMKEISFGNALFFKSNNADELINIISQLPGMHERLKELSKKGKQIANETYPKDLYLKKLLTIYDEAVNSY